jgi:hypothetical protein
MAMTAFRLQEFTNQSGVELLFRQTPPRKNVARLVRGAGYNVHSAKTLFELRVEA